MLKKKVSFLTYSKELVNFFCDKVLMPSISPNVLLYLHFPASAGAPSSQH